MRVSDILKSKGTAVCTIGPDATIADAVRALHQCGIGAIVGRVAELEREAEALEHYIQYGR